MLEGGKVLSDSPRRKKRGRKSCAQHLKMLEICLKLVGCKSKKGLSSSSSCYLEGEIREGVGEEKGRPRDRLQPAAGFTVPLS